jgi:hypothetical protein
MKQIKDYLRNQKEVYTIMWVNSMKAEEVNLADVKYWLEKIIFIEQEIEGINKKK